MLFFCWRPLLCVNHLLWPWTILTFSILFFLCTRPRIAEQAHHPTNYNFKRRSFCWITVPRTYHKKVIDTLDTLTNDLREYLVKQCIIHISCLTFANNLLLWMRSEDLIFQASPTVGPWIPQLQQPILNLIRIFMIVL